MSTAQHEVEYLGRSNNIHVVSVDKKAVIVHDNVISYAVGGSDGKTVYTVYTRFEKARSCTCPAGKWGKPCRHKLAVEAVVAKW